jgi:lipid A 3-O-deacylase
MKVFCIILFFLQFLTSCQQQVKRRDVVQMQSPLIINYPAGVMVNSQKKIPGLANHNVTIAEQILSLHQIPVLDTNASQLVFVKTNGDRVSFSMEDLAGNYDIILFNAVNNPVPLRIADLQDAYKQIFNSPAVTRNTTESFVNVRTKFSRITDSVVQKPSRNRFALGKSPDKRIVIITADTSSRKFMARTIPGIQWIEQKADTRTILKINFENDLITYANTDRYFTSGISFDLQAAWLGRLPVRKLMIPYRHQAFVTYTLSVVQDIYTPADTRVAPTLHNDRPYASYLYFGYRKTVADALRNLKITTQLDAGYIGPLSPGSYLQTLVHKTFPTNDKPLGWETQIRSDIILNYTILAQKALVSKENFSLLAGADVNAGTLYNKAGAGLQLQAGKAEPVFGLAENEHWPKAEYYFFAKTGVSFVAYNALLQGGILNQDNIFTLKANEIERVVGNAEAGFHFRYKGMGIELAQHYLSPEYKRGLWHKWGRVSLLVRL